MEKPRHFEKVQHNGEPVRYEGKRFAAFSGVERVSLIADWVGG